MKVYTILKASYEYNDEYYYKSSYGDDCGAPVIAYKDAAVANAEARKLNEEEFASNDICNFIGEDGLTDEQLEELVQLDPALSNLEAEEHFQSINWSKLSKDVRCAVWGIVQPSYFYTVIPLEVA